MREIMRRASRVVLNATADGTHELRTDKTIVCHPNRYTDPRGDAIWEHVSQLIAAHQKTREDKRA